MDCTKGDANGEEIREEIEELKREIKALREFMEERRRKHPEKVLISLNSDLIEDAVEPFHVVARDIVRSIRESIRRGLMEKGEEEVSSIVKYLPETDAAEVLKSLANPERLKIMKYLYDRSSSFTELKESTGLESSSLSHHLRQLSKVGLLEHKPERERYLLTSRGRLLMRITALMHEALRGEKFE